MPNPSSEHIEQITDTARHKILINQTAQNWEENTSTVRVRGILLYNGGQPISHIRADISRQISGADSYIPSDFGFYVYPSIFWFPFSQFTYIDHSFVIKHDAQGFRSVEFTVTYGNTNSEFGGYQSCTAALVLSRIPKKPSPPGQPVFSNITPTSVTVSWPASADNSGSPINFYRLRRYEVANIPPPPPVTTSILSGAIAEKKMTVYGSGSQLVPGDIAMNKMKVAGSLAGRSVLTGDISRKKMTISAVGYIVLDSAIAMKKMGVAGSLAGKAVTTGNVSRKKMSVAGSGSAWVEGSTPDWIKLLQPTAGGTMNVCETDSQGRMIGGCDMFGIYFSDDRGISWSGINDGLDHIAGLADHCAAVAWSVTEPDVAYALSGDRSGGGFIARDFGPKRYGLPWVMRSAKPQGAGNGGAGPLPGAAGPRSTGRLIAQDGTYVYVGTYNQGVMRTSVQNGVNAGADGFAGPGAEFNIGGAAPGAHYYCRALAIDPDNGDLYAGFYDHDGTGTYGGLWRCTTPKAAQPNFTRVPGCPDMVEDIAFCDGKVYVVSHNKGVSSAVTGLWSYDKAAGTWRNAAALAGGKIDSKASWWNSVDAILVGTTHKVAITCNNAVASPGTGFACFIRVDIPTHGDGTPTYTVLSQANVDTDHMWPSGVTYKCTWVGGTLGGGGFKNSNVRFDPDDPTGQKIWISGSEGMTRSEDGGVNWKYYVTGYAGFHVWVVSVDPVHAGRILFGTGDFGGWCVSDALGQDAAGVEHDSPGGQIRSVAWDPTDQTVYAGWTTKQTTSQGGQVSSRAWNSPGNWSPVGSPDLASKISGWCPGGVIAMREGGNKAVIACVQTQGIWKWTAAAGWVRKSTAAFAGAQPATTSTAYAGNGVCFAFDRGKGLWRSTDYGETWSVLWAYSAQGSMSDTNISLHPTTNGELWVSVTAGLYKMSGAVPGTGTFTVTQITNTSIPSAVRNDNLWVCCNPADGSVWVTTKDTGNGAGIWRSTDHGASWTDMDPDGSFGRQSDQVWMMTFGQEGRCYVGVGGILNVQASTDVPPPPPPPPPPGTRPARLIGANTAATLAEFNNAYAQFGTLQFQKVFYSGGQGIGQGGRYQAGGQEYDVHNAHPSVLCQVCYKDVLTQAQWDTYIHSVPATLKEMWLTYHQEPEGDYAQGSSFVTNWNTCVTRARNSIASGTNKTTRFRFAMSASTYQYGTGANNPEAQNGNFLPAASMCDIYGADLYMQQDVSGAWPKTGLKDYNRFQTWLSAVAKKKSSASRMGLTEYGINDGSNAPGGVAARYDRLQNDRAYLETFTGTDEFECWNYWWRTDSPDASYRWKFTDANSLNLWTEVAALGGDS